MAKRKLKIFFLLPNLEGGGSERVISIVANHLNRELFEPTLVLLQKKGIYLETIAGDINIISLNKQRVRYIGMDLVKLLKREKPDLVVSTLGHLNLFISLVKPLFPKATKFIARESSTISERNKDESLPYLFDILFKTVYKRFDKIICQCNYMRQDLVTNYGLPSSKISVIYNPLDLSLIHKSISKEKYPFPESDLNKSKYLVVGRLSREKRIDHVLIAFAKFADKERHHLYIIGDGVLKKHLQDKVIELQINEAVSFLGVQKNPFKYMAAADCLISSSIYEGFPNVVLESNACGTPVVAYNYPGGINEIVSDGVNGIIVDNGNIAQLSVAMKNISDQAFDKEAIIEQTYKSFNIPLILSEFESLFLSTCRMDIQ